MENIQQVPVDKTRLVLSALGALVGRNLIAVNRRSVDISFSDKVQNGTLTTSREVPLWSTEKIYVKGFDHDFDANGNIVVRFNGDDALTMPLINVKGVEDLFPKISPTTLREVYEEAKAEGRRAIFVDYPGAVRQVVNLNRGSKTELSKLVDELMQHITVIDDANVIEKQTCEIEMQKLGEPITISIGNL